jgi:NADH-quinone oxidoreductase subunit M
MVVGGIGTLLTAGYFLWMLQRVNMGRLPDRWKSAPLSDLLGVEAVAWTPLILLIFALGLAPGLLLSITNPAVEAWFGGLFS